MTISVLSTSSGRFLTFMLVAVLVVAGLASLSFLSPQSGSGTQPTIATKSKDQGGTAYMNVPRVYSALGYPKITYNANNIRYVAPETNINLTYHNTSVNLHVGRLSE